MKTSASSYPAVTAFPQSVPSPGGRFLLFISYSLFFLLIILFSVGVSPRVNYLVGAFTILSTVLLMYVNLFSALCLVILVTHIGPIVSIPLPGVGIITMGDIYIILLTLFFFAKWLKSGFYPGPFFYLIIPAFFLLMTNFILTPSQLIALSGLNNIFQLALVYFFTLNEVKTQDQAFDIIKAMVLAIAICAMMHLFFYTQGKSMLVTGTDIEPWEALDEGAGGYTKTTFFYGSFTASRVAGAILCLTYVFLNEQASLLSLLSWNAALVIIITSGLVSGSRTSLYSVLITGFMILWVKLTSFFRYGFKRMFSFIVSLTLILLVILGGLVIQRAMVSSQQEKYFQQSFVGDAQNSFMGRVLMWQHALKQLHKFPKELIIGIGPNVPIKGGHLPEVRRLMYVPALKFQVPSFHNFYIDVLFQYGIFGLAMMLWVIIVTLVKLYKKISVTDQIACFSFFAIFGWLIAWNVHATGWGKPVIILSQLFAVSHLVISGRLDYD